MRRLVPVLALASSLSCATIGEEMRTRRLLADGRDGADGCETFETPAFAAARPEITVGITAFNYERFIVPCLESVLASRGVRIECIVVDDRSSDGTVAAVRSAIEGNPGFPLRLVARRSNRGLPAGVGADAGDIARDTPAAGGIQRPYTRRRCRYSPTIR